MAENDVAALYRRYGDMVLGRCRLLLGNDADAQEAAQEIFLKIHRLRDGFRGDASWSTYLFRATTTTCLNWLRTRKRRREDPVPELPERAGAFDSLVDTLAVRQLLDELTRNEDERTQAILVYVFVDGMTQDEAGEQLGITGAAVRKRISTFRGRLRESPPAWLAELEALDHLGGAGS